MRYKLIAFVLLSGLFLSTTSVYADGQLSRITKSVNEAQTKVKTIEADLTAKSKVLADKNKAVENAQKILTSNQADKTQAAEQLSQAKEKLEKAQFDLSNTKSKLQKTIDKRDSKDKAIEQRDNALRDSWNLAKLKDGWSGMVNLVQNKDSELIVLTKDRDRYNEQIKQEMSDVDTAQELVDREQTRYNHQLTIDSKFKKSLSERMNAVKTATDAQSKAEQEVLRVKSDLDKVKETLNELTSKKQDVEKNLAKYAVGNADSKFTDEEDVALFNQVKDKQDPGNEGLTTHTRQMRNFIMAKFNVTNAGGFRNDDDGTGHGHGTGLAVDFMADKETGDKIAKYIENNFDALDVYYQIWEQRYFMNMRNIYGPANTWNKMPDRGGATANHYDHVHVSFAK